MFFEIKWHLENLVIAIPGCQSLAACWIQAYLCDYITIKATAFLWQMPGFLSVIIEY